MTEKMKKMSEEAAKRVSQKYPELQELLREEKSKGWDILKGIDWMIDEELMEKFIEEKSDIDDLFKAWSLREDDVCELTLKDIKNIIKYVNEQYDLNLSWVNHELIWN